VKKRKRTAMRNNLPLNCLVEVNIKKSEELTMILFFEAVFLHGFILFWISFQALIELNCYLSISTRTEAAEVHQDVEIPVEMALWGLPRQQIAQQVLDEPYVESVLSTNQESFFTLFSESVNPLPTTTDVESVEDDMLTMAAWREDPEPVTVTTTLAASANAKISEHKVGEQLWVVEIVGEEQGFLHVSDGSGRAWINSNGFGTFSRKDIASVLVDRKTDLLVDLLAADILQKHSTDFSMADELDCMDCPDYVEVVGA